MTRAHCICINLFIRYGRNRYTIATELTSEFIFPSAIIEHGRSGFYKACMMSFMKIPFPHNTFIIFTIRLIP